MAFADIDLARLLIALAVLLLAAHGVGALFARFRQPAAVGEIVGGILLGPSALGAAFPAVQHWIFPATGSSAAAKLSATGMRGNLTMPHSIASIRLKSETTQGKSVPYG